MQLQGIQKPDREHGLFCVGDTKMAFALSYEVRRQGRVAPGLAAQR